MSSFSSDKYPEVELLDHMRALFFNFLRKFSAVFHSGFMYIGSLWATQQQRLQIAITTGTFLELSPLLLLNRDPFITGASTAFSQSFQSVDQPWFMDLRCKKLSSLAAPYTLLGWRLLAV